jgi:hypothetical protein
MFHFRQEDNAQKTLAEQTRKFGARLETAKRIFLVRFAHKQGVSASSARNATRQIHFVHSYKTTFAHKVYTLNLEFFQLDSADYQSGFEISFVFTL